MKINNFTTRTISGAVFVAILIAGIIIGYETFLLLMLIIIGLTINEFYNLVKKSGVSPNYALGLIAGLGTFISFFTYALGGYEQNGLLALPMVIYVFIFIAELFRDKENAFTNVAMTLLGVFYIALPFATINFLCFFYSPSQDAMYYSADTILIIFLLVWINDTFAYLTGMSIGKHKFFERISPKKTWEGIAGGILFTLLATAGMYYLRTEYEFFSTFNSFDLPKWLGLGLVVSIFADLGDLVESMLKRSLNIKDSGNIIPGHGGMLDRFDAILLAAPAAFVYLMFMLN